MHTPNTTPFVKYVMHEIKGFTAVVQEEVYGEWTALVLDPEGNIFTKETGFNFEPAAREASERQSKSLRYHLS